MPRSHQVRSASRIIASAVWASGILLSNPARCIYGTGIVFKLPAACQDPALCPVQKQCEFDCIICVLDSPHLVVQEDSYEAWCV